MNSDESSRQKSDAERGIRPPETFPPEPVARRRGFLDILGHIASKVPAVVGRLRGD